MSRIILIGAVACLVGGLWLLVGGSAVSPLAQAQEVDSPNFMDGNAAPSAGSTTLEYLTNPSKDLWLSFVRPGMISDVKVKPGDVVDSNAILATQDDAAERQQLAQLDADATDDVRVRASQKQLELKQNTKKKYDDVCAVDPTAVTPIEYDQVKLEVEMAVLQLELEKFTRKQNGRKADELRIQIDRMKVVAPCKARVQSVPDKGACVEAGAKVIHLVVLDPLWVDVPVPMSQAEKLTEGQKANVRFHSKGGQTVAGTIIWMSSVADGATETRLVRVEVPNKSNRIAGERVQVEFVAGNGVKKEQVPAEAKKIAAGGDVTAGSTTAKE